MRYYKNMETNIKPGDYITPAATDDLGPWGPFLVLSVHPKWNRWNQYVGTSFLVQDMKGKNGWARGSGAKLVQSHA